MVESPKKQGVRQMVSEEDIVKRISELEIKKVVEDISRD